MTPRLPLPRAVLLALCAVLIPTGAASAQPDATPSETEREAASRLEESIRVVQQRPILRRHRVEAQLLGGLGLTDTMFRHLHTAGQLRFHLSEAWAIGGGYAHYLSDTSSLFDEVTKNYELFPERAMLEMAAYGEVVWTPVYGKFAFFDGPIVHFDLALVAGGGIVRSSRTVDLKPTVVGGGAFHLYFTRWLALTAEIKHHIYLEEYHAGRDLVNHLVAQLGLAFYVPFGFDYRFPR